MCNIINKYFIYSAPLFKIIFSLYFPCIDANFNLGVSGYNISRCMKVLVIQKEDKDDAV